MDFLRDVGVTNPWPMTIPMDLLTPHISWNALFEGTIMGTYAPKNHSSVCTRANCTANHPALKKFAPLIFLSTPTEWTSNGNPHPWTEAHLRDHGDSGISGTTSKFCALYSEALFSSILLAFHWWGTFSSDRNFSLFPTQIQWNGP